MKALFSYNGKLQLTQTHEPLGGVQDLVIENIYSAFSTGTETSRIRAQALDTRIFNKGFLPLLTKTLAQTSSPTTLVRKARKFLGFYERLGYSSVGRVRKLGSHVHRDFRVGDLVVAGGETANHNEVIAVPQGLVEKLDPSDKVSPFHSLAFIMSIPLHSLNLVNFQRTQKLLIIGGGLIGSLACAAARFYNLDFRFLDLRNDSLCHLLFPDSILKEGDSGFSAIVCSAPSLVGINDIIRDRTIKGVALNVLGEASLADLDKQTIEEQYGTVSFCNSFGFGRRIWSYEKDGNVSEALFPFTIQHNVQQALSILRSPGMAKLLNHAASIERLGNFSVKPSRINILQYGC